MQKIITVLIIVIVLIVGFFLWTKFQNQEQAQTGLANPASVNCINQGGKLDIVTEASSGGQIGICHFPDGKSCEEWSYFRTGVCTSTSSATPQ